MVAEPDFPRLDRMATENLRDAAERAGEDASSISAGCKLPDMHLRTSRRAARTGEILRAGGIAITQDPLGHVS